MKLDIRCNCGNEDNFIEIDVLDYLDKDNELELHCNECCTILRVKITRS
jgi:hypothetical protein